MVSLHSPVATPLESVLLVISFNLMYRLSIGQLKITCLSIPIVNTRVADRGSEDDRHRVVRKAHSKLFIDSMYSTKDLRNNLIFFKICRIMTSLYDVINVSAKFLLHIKYAYGFKVYIDALIVKICRLIVLI